MCVFNKKSNEEKINFMKRMSVILGVMMVIMVVNVLVGFVKGTNDSSTLCILSAITTELCCVVSKLKKLKAN